MKKKILVLAANPKGDLHLKQEIQDLKNLLVKNINFDIQIETATSIEILKDRLPRYQPFVVHFCGHGAGKQGLILVDKSGIEKRVSNEDLASLFKSHGEGIECIVLNACYTEVQADVIAEYIPYVIGTSREILDRVAHYFSKGFYKGIAEEEAIETCYEWGYISIKKNLQEDPELSELVAYIDDIDNKSRKLEVVYDGEIQPNVEPLEIILKHNDVLESEFTSNVSPKLEQEFIEEGRRKRYKDNLRNILNNFGQRIITREKQIDDFELKQRDTLISKVQDFWIGGFLKPSLYFNTATDIDNDHPSGQILRPLDNLEVIPFDIEQSYDSVKNSDITNQISDGQTLLILGEPGSGKTIALLQLAERLVAESRENSKKPIPLVFNLSSWVEKQLPLEEWLIEELRDKYQVPKAWSKPWIERQELILLLDGLDEVKANYRNACVRAIREFNNTHQATEIVVCSRIKDYEALVERLLLSSVICIQPLSRKQLLDFLENADDSLSGLKTVIKQDSGIFQFATTPLILNMMTWTYHGWSVEQCYEQFQNPEYREFNLFESYIEQNLAKEHIEKKYHKNRIVYWLSYLGKQIINESNTLFLIEKMQPSWLVNKKLIRKFFFIFSLLIGLVYGTVAFTLISVFYSFSYGLLYGFINMSYVTIASYVVQGNTSKLISHRRIIACFYGVFVWLFATILIGLHEVIVLDRNFAHGLMIGLFDGLIQGFATVIILGFGIYSTEEIQLCDNLNWNWKAGFDNTLKNSSLFALIGAAVIGFIQVFIADKSIDIRLFWDCIQWAVKFGVFSGFIILLVNGLKNQKSIETGVYPNYGIQKSFRNSWIMGIIFMCMIFVVHLDFLNSVDRLINGILGFFLGGLFFGGGIACIQHLTLRLMLSINTIIPWNYSKFLDYASERLLMKKIGGGYVFYHRMLMEHFANMELEK